jgi:hypothetical protein
MGNGNGTGEGNSGIDKGTYIKNNLREQFWCGQRRVRLEQLRPTLNPLIFSSYFVVEGVYGTRHQGGSLSFLMWEWFTVPSFLFTHFLPLPSQRCTTQQHTTPEGAESQTTCHLFHNPC